MVDGAPVRARDPVLDRGDVTTRPANASPVDPAFPLVTGVVTAGVVPIVVSVVGDEVPGADSSTTVVAAVAWRPDRRPVAVSEWLPASTSGTENVSVVAPMASATPAPTTTGSDSKTNSTSSPGSKPVASTWISSRPAPCPADRRATAAR